MDTGTKMINDFWFQKNRLKTNKSRLNWSFHYLKKPALDWLNSIEDDGSFQVTATIATK